MISLTSPIRTRAHDWPAGVKFAGLCVATLALFFIEDVAVNLAIFAAVMMLYVLPGAVFFLAGLRQLRILWPFILVVLVWHIWVGEAEAGLVIVLRLSSAVALANLVTMTTRLTDMIGVVRRICAPLTWFGLRTNVLELAIALVIRLTPVLLIKGRQLSESWRARSHRRSTWRIILPFTILALDDADHVAEALRARGGFNTKETS
ncbi:energy-coupling factor transporter transmembrane protein EcfT [uncultured Roseovarius sp.]|uniref:energy-coupling factor transporter transmembrane component T family protein n=1 Tax=uncultured Roseovarius sp. TaxID=293344 RepID=UPI0026226B87|nr:energy-coupling factor transporter transmembrane component T [uncultured Roseovarius sp.]